MCLKKKVSANHDVSNFARHVNQEVPNVAGYVPCRRVRRHITCGIPDHFAAYRDMYNDTAPLFPDIEMNYLQRTASTGHVKPCILRKLGQFSPGTVIVMAYLTRLKYTML